jgi:hypothetical protein
VVNSFKKIRPAAGGLATTGLNSNDYSVEAPFTDDADKGDLRLDYQQDANSSWFLRISDRKETGVNHVTIPLPLDGQTNGTIRILDQQAALGYTHLFGRGQDSGCAAGDFADEGGQVQPVDWRRRVRDSWIAVEPGGGGRIAFGGDYGLHGIRAAEHESAVAEPGAARSQGELHVGEGAITR